MIALTTSGEESASPIPSSPVSVRTRTRTESWLLAVFAWTFGIRRIWQTTSVIFMSFLGLTTETQRTQRCEFAFYVCSVPLWLVHHSSPPGLYDPSLHDCDKSRPILQDRNVRDHVAIDHKDVGQLACFKRTEFIVATDDLRAEPGRALDRLQRREAD